jgi:hypothetical protein
MIWSLNSIALRLLNTHRQPGSAADVQSAETAADVSVYSNKYGTLGSTPDEWIKRQDGT